MALRGSRRRIREVPFPAQVGLVAFVYWAAAKLSIGLAIPPGYASAVWPPSGIALAAVLLLGARVWPGVWVGAALANVAVESSLLTAVSIATGNTLEALAACALMRRHAVDPGRFEHAQDVFKFIVFCAVGGAVAATVAMLPLAIGHPLSRAEGLRNWWTWWQGDVAGMLICAPLLLSLVKGDATAWRPEKKLEAVFFGFLLLAAAAAITAGKGTHFAPFSLTFVALPFIIWAASRFGQREVTATIAVVCAVAVSYLLDHRDLFPTLPLNELLLMFLAFISIVVTTGLVLVAAFAESRRALDDLTHHDPVTGLPNIALFRDRLARMLEVAGEKGERVVVAVMGIDRFKAVNDALGWQAGDEVLLQIARHLTGDASEDGLVARLNGVQFAMAGRGIENERDAARAVEERLGRWFGLPFAVGESELRLAARMGIAFSPEDGVRPDTLLLNAESALKKAKAAGEPYLFYHQRMAERAGEKLSLENRLRQAIEKQEFVLYYQPKIHLDTRKVIGFEALVRWNSPESGQVPPAHFIPLLEETGLIMEVGTWVLEQAVRDLALWTAQGLVPPPVSVNVSSMQLRQRNFVEVVRDAVRPATIAWGGIELEITESRIMDDIEANIVKLRALREIGFGITIDDFGTGHSSLSYLTRLPVQTLKIDRSFVSKMLDDDGTMALVQTIISLAQTLKLTTVAEGVETDDQADVLELLRCDQMQGYLFSRPLTFQDAATLIRTGGKR